MGNGLIINHNLSALTASNKSKLQNTAMAKSMEKLSSGLRINRAADDAAGLSISEKMRGQLAALNRASRNIQDGISLVQTAEGALDEVHAMLSRMEELTVQAANDTYSTDDKSNLQLELDELKGAINNITQNTSFNSIGLFKSSATTQPLKTPTPITTMSLQQALASVSDNDLNIIFDDMSISEYATTQTTSGTNTTAGYDPDFVDQLEKQIVPNAIKTLLNAYPAFNYLAGSSVGIGLRLYSDTSNVLASVKCGILYSQKGSTVTDADLTYTLSVNMNAVNWDATTNTITNRSDLEATIAHEMTHALMDEALTSGMLGITTSGKDSSASFPQWFKEGMAQAASGPGNWVKYSLKLTKDSTNSAIKSALSKLSSNTSEAQYGSGYLAVTYLGYLANGGTGTVTAKGIANGLNNILHSLISGNSLDSTLKNYTNGKYTSLSNFQSAVQNDSNAYDFVRNLISNSKNGLGSVITGDLNDDDVLDDNALNINLFKLNPSVSEVKNDYDGLGVEVLSGGGNSTTGSKPVSTYPASPTTPIIPSTPEVTSNINLANFNDIIEITDGGTYTITGIGNSNVRIKIADGVNATINLNNATLKTTSGSAISIGKNSNITIKTSGTNSITTSDASGFGIDNQGTLWNYGTLSTSINNDGKLLNKGKITTSINGSGTLKHAVSNISKNIQKPKEVPAGVTLSSPATSKITVTYNGGQTRTLAGTWSVSEGSNTISDFSTAIAEEGKTYTYKLTFTSEDNISFGSSSINFLENTNQLMSYSDISNAMTTNTPSVSADGKTITYSYTFTARNTAASPTAISNPDSITFRVGNNADETITYNVATLDSTSLGIDSIDVTQSTTGNTDLIHSAISQVSTIRATLGALQNRLEYTYNNVTNTHENLTAAESRIRDTDMAKTMIDFSKENILLQAAQAMLSQANTTPNRILDLLR